MFGLSRTEKTSEKVEQNPEEQFRRLCELVEPEHVEARREVVREDKEFAAQCKMHRDYIASIEIKVLERLRKDSELSRLIAECKDPSGLVFKFVQDLIPDLDDSQTPAYDRFNQLYLEDPNLSERNQLSIKLVDYGFDLGDPRRNFERSGREVYEWVLDQIAKGSQPTLAGWSDYNNSRFNS